MTQARSIPRSWTSTLKLPKSTFPPRASPAEQTKYLKRSTDELYAWQRHERPANQPFVLHDGPPYANGELHVGHALNKILKDIICRVQLGRGKRVRYVPGWDCHGLPIELKALQGLQAQGTQDIAVTPAVIRQSARKLAGKTVKEQMKGFRGFGVMADWENHWKTMDKGFEMRQLGIFREMVDRGLIYRKFKPVYWSPSTGTALAEAELEYKEDHISTAALVKFPLVKISEHLTQDVQLQATELSAVIWTTTPWTLPANAAIAVNESLEYAIVRSEKHGYLLIAKSRIEYLESMLKENLNVVSSILGSELAEKTTYRPLFKSSEAEPQPIIGADFVTADSGSGLVHCAPGHGMDDYEACLTRGIPVFAPVDDEGKFTEKAMPHDPKRLAGKAVLGEGNIAALEYVETCGQLLVQHRYEHKYPHDWRSKLPIIIRATEQWFADVADIRGGALRALEEVRFVPESGKKRLENFVKNRSEWCISRQRAWGVPIPALYHRTTGEAVLTKDSVSHIMRTIEERGVDAWWTDSANDVSWVPSSMREDPAGYRRGTDTMDVWFDSGTSWSEIDVPMEGRSHPADVYLEGSDQHRGWFQSGLLTYIAHQLASGKTETSRAPFRNLITHGFTLDEDGRKMSKSIGNVILPQTIMNGTLLPPLKPRKGKGKKTAENQEPAYDALGPDALRLWAASSDYTRDVVIGKQVLQTVHASLHKFRVTFKLLLGALSDFRPENLVPYQQLQQVDRIALKHLSDMVLSSQKACENFEFYKAVNIINRWANLEFSAFYMEAIKDRLYTLGEDSVSRRAAQTTLFHAYHHLQEVLGPVTPLLVEETWEHTPAAIREHSEHPLRRLTSTPAVEWQDLILDAHYHELVAVHSVIKNLQEQARGKKQLGSSLQSFVHLELPDMVENSVFQQYLAELPDLFVVSSVTFGQPGSIPAEISQAEWKYQEACEFPGGQKGQVYVFAPAAAKCARCWRYAVPAPASSDAICTRCDAVVDELDKSSH